MIKHAELWLVRHGAAGDKLKSNDEGQDWARTLNPQGAKQSVRAGKLLHELVPKVDALYSSPRLRCVQTANLIAPMIGCDAETKDRLDETLEQHPKRILGLIKDGSCVVMVGHGPEWKSVIKKLTGRQVWLYRGGIAQITIKNGQATVGALLQPADVKRMT